MQVPVGFYTRATVKERASFSCRRCKHWQRAEVVSTSIGVQSHLGARGTAATRATANAARDVQRTLAFATCPNCKRRGGYLAFVARDVIVAVVIVALSIPLAYALPGLKPGFDADEAASFHVYMPLIVAAIAVIATPWALVRRWRHNDARVRWLEL